MVGCGFRLEGLDLGLRVGLGLQFVFLVVFGFRAWGPGIPMAHIQLQSIYVVT